MKPLAQILVALVLLAIPACNQKPSQTQTDANAPQSQMVARVLGAIQAFETDPLSAEGKAAQTTILIDAYKNKEFASQVEGILPPALVPHTTSDPGLSKSTKTILMTAYVAGNFQSQLDHHVKGNDSYAGVQQELRTYAQLKNADSSLHSPTMEKLAALQQENKLRGYVDEVVSKIRTPKR